MLPRAGLKVSTRGATVKTAALDAVAPAVTLMEPVTASAGTTAVILVLLTMPKEAGEELPNLTWVAELKPVPLMVTVVPGAPFVGVKLVMLCACTSEPAASQTSANHLPACHCFKKSTALIGPEKAPTGKPLRVIHRQEKSLDAAL